MKPLSDNEEMQVIRYVDKNMTPDEKIAFENKLNENFDLQQALTFEIKFRSLGLSVQQKIIDHYDMPAQASDLEIATMIKNAAKVWQSENVAKEKSGIEKEIKKHANFTTNLWKRMAAAAMVVGIMAVSVIFLFKNDKPTAELANKIATGKAALSGDSILEKAPLSKDGEQNEIIFNVNRSNTLFASNFTPDDVAIDVPEFLLKPLSYYETKQYKEALRRLKKTNPNSGSRGNEDKQLAKFYISYYKALSLLAIGNAPQALPLLHEAFNTNPHKNFEAKINWYLALAYLKTGNLSKATEQIKKLVTPKPNLYTSKAFHLQKALGVPNK